MQPVFVVLIIFVAVSLVILLPQWLRSKERQRALEAVVVAAEKGLTLSPEPIAALLADVRKEKPALPVHVRDLRRGTILLGLAAGFVVVGIGLFALLQAAGATEEALPVGIGVATVGAIPALIGGAYLLLARIARHADVQGYRPG